MTLRIPIGLSCALGVTLLVATGAGPAPAAIVKLNIKGETGLTFTSQFNPTTFLVEKTVPWTTVPGHVEPPGQQFESPLPTLLTATLLLDTQSTDQDVADLVHPLEQLSSIDPALLRPPMVQVQYGSFTFNGVIESLSVKYSQFQPDGTKDRATVKIAIRGASTASVTR